MCTAMWIAAMRDSSGQEGQAWRKQEAGLA
jgi:hypothetical protein